MFYLFIYFVVLFMYVPVCSCHHHHFLSCNLFAPLTCALGFLFGIHSNWTVICFYQQAKQNLGPGEYDLKSFLHELNGSYLKLFSSWTFSFFAYFSLLHLLSRLFSFFLCFVRQAQKPPWSFPQGRTFPGVSHQQGLLFYAESISQGSGKSAAV